MLSILVVRRDYKEMHVSAKILILIGQRHLNSTQKHNTEIQRKITLLNHKDTNVFEIL